MTSPVRPKLTARLAVCYGHNVLTQNALGQPHRPHLSYWWWSVCAEEGCLLARKPRGHEPKSLPASG